LARADLAVAVALVEAAGAAVREATGSPVVAEAKTAATDVVTAADQAAEAAMVAILAAERPEDGILGEEGASAAAGAGGRTWVLDALDGTLNFATGLGPYCCAAALVQGDRARAVAVLDPVGGGLWTAAAGEGAFANGVPIRAGGPESLSEAILATYAHPDRKGRAGVLGGFTALVAHAGMLRIIGSGTLDLAWVAEGRLHGWVQPGVEPWDWHPGALLVTEAGGVEAEVMRAGTPWRIAAANPALLEQIAAVVGESG
jgi:myo-inositol-1(or 4)-monophosphatase